MHLSEIYVTLAILGSMVTFNAEYVDTDFESPALFSIHSDVNELLNQQIQSELHASQAYLAMAAFFGREDVNKIGFKEFFLKSADEEYEHAKKFIAYLNSRNGRLNTLSVDPPIMFEFGPPGVAGTRAFEEAIALESKVSARIKHLHDIVSSGKKNKAHHDPHLTDYLESEWIKEQVDSIRELKGLLHTLKNMGEPKLAEFLFDKHLLEKK